DCGGSAILHKDSVDADGKQLPFGEALPGASALELLLPLTLQWAAECALPLVSALARITCDPAAILGIAGGSMRVGSAADLCLFDPVETWQVTADTLRSQGKNTPYLGRQVTGRVRMTLVGGRIVYQR
ncbi:MAG TPA: amidohydrolase family protein, partial [Accumulibacter sp.]|nr:amidohydrolase family protein [Accumulibacter sp.]